MIATDAGDPLAGPPRDGSSGDLINYVKDWRPGPQTHSAVLEAAPVAALSNVLGGKGSPLGSGLPPLWHWLYFNEWSRSDLLGTDGHPAAAHFLPPVPARRRKVAGGRVEFREPLVIGEQANRVTVLRDIRATTGASGEMLFVTTRQEIYQAGSLRAVEEVDVVYHSGEPMAKETPAHGMVSEPLTNAEWVARWRPDAILLFRFSALTANSHRIHYDQDYCRHVENYPDVVVHGPLLAIFMAELVREQSAAVITGFDYRLRRPAFVGEALAVTGTPVGRAHCDLQVSSARAGAVATATVKFS